MNYDAFFDQKLGQLKAAGNYRVFAELERCAGRFPSAKRYDDGGDVADVTVWCSNDYLGMGQHPDVLAEMIQAIEMHGAGAGGTRNISGTNHLHVLLEDSLAALHGKEKALLFTSGYVANLATLATLGARLPDCTIYSDALNHNSMIEGMRQSKARKKIWKHNDPQDLDRILSEDDPAAAKIVAFESVYSMDGDIAPIAEILDVCEKHHALSFLDEVHAVGMYGHSGAGVSERDDVAGRVDIIQGTLAKAFGVIGGYIAGKAKMIDFVRSFGNAFIFTTALPPAVAAGALKSVEIVKNSPEMRDRHQDRAARLKRRLRENGLPVMPSVTHIVPVLVGDPVKCRAATDMLLDRYGIYVQPINYPTVPEGTERLRLTPSPYHTDDAIERLVCALTEVWASLALQKAA